MAPAMDSEWETYKRESARLSSQIEQKLMALQMLQGGSGRHEQEDSNVLQAETLRLLEELRSISEKISSGQQPLSTREWSHVERNRQVHDENAQELKRVAKALVARQEKEELIGTVRNTLQEYSESQQVLDVEATRISRAEKEVNQLHSIAVGGHEAMLRTNTAMERTHARLRELATKVPVVHNVLNQISRRQNRNNIILAGVVSVCLFILWLFY
eukprot:Rhum_TRINITY_DN24968_c0_g1::Rhum_TRINITY_DN24968_c0_g1_i1::g.180716::m.180716/K08495/GOSR1, GOS1; golgi SNAP receptor complex member 1